MSRPNKTTLFIAGLLAFVLLNPITNAETYKWTDSSGKTHYTDRLPAEEVEHKEIDVGECKTDKCRNDLKQDQIEAAKQLQEAEKWLNERDTERKKQEAQQQQSKSNRKKPPGKTGFLGY